MENIEEFEQNPPAFAALEADEQDPEQTAREYLENLPEDGQAQILITKLPVTGKAVNEYVNPCRTKNYCGSFDFFPDESFEAIYRYTQENYEGGKYRFQIRIGRQNGQVWQQTLSDLPGTRPRFDEEFEFEQTAPAAPAPIEQIAFAPAPPAAPLDPIDELIRHHEKMAKLKKTLIGDDAPAPAPVAVIAANEIDKSAVLKLLQSSTDPETVKLCRDLLGLNADKPSFFEAAGDVVIELITDSDAREKTFASVTKTAMPYVAPILERLWTKAKTDAATQQTGTATTGDQKTENVSQIVANEQTAALPPPPVQQTATPRKRRRPVNNDSFED